MPCTTIDRPRNVGTEYCDCSTNLNTFYTSGYPQFYACCRPPYVSLYHCSRLNCLSSLATVLFAPHLDLITSVTAFCIACLFFASPSVAIETSIPEQSNFLESFFTDHVRGSAPRSFLISSKSASVKWYLFSYGFRTGGGSLSFPEGVKADVPASSDFV